MTYKINFTYGHMFYFNEHMYISANSFEEALIYAKRNVPVRPAWASPYIRISINKI